MDSIAQRTFDYLEKKASATTSQIADELGSPNESILPALKRHPDVFLRGERSKGRPVTWSLAPGAKRPQASKWRATRGAEASPAFATASLDVLDQHAWRPKRKASQSDWSAAKVEFVDWHMREFSDWIADRQA